MSRGTKIKEIEEFPRRIKIFFFVIIFLLILGTTGFMLISGESFRSSFYRTTQTLAFMFQEDSPIAERYMEIFLAVVGVFLVWWVLWSIADMLLDGNLHKYLKSKYYNLKIKNMENHIIIVGGGRVGEEIARVLKEDKKRFIIIESDPHVFSNLKKKFLVYEGDAMNEETLKKAKIGKASKIILTLPQTEKNILITLTAKELNPNIEVHSRCENISLVPKLKRAGAKIVTVPEIIAADKIAADISKQK
jgi:voltage-gated potassium channel